MQTSGKSGNHTRRRIGRLAIVLGLAGLAGIPPILSGCGPILQVLAEDITGIPLVTGSPTLSPLPTGSTTITPTTPTAAATASPTAQPVFFNTTVFGNAAITAPATYPSGFFTAGQDISNNIKGEGTITPGSATKSVQLSVTASNSASRPQIQFRDAVTLGTVFTSLQNIASQVLTTSFVPGTTDPLLFSVIDTGIAASGVNYTIQIQQ